jgi:hypothetical protein
MSLKIKSPVFIDRLTLEVDHPQRCFLRAVLKDDTGTVCSALETEVKRGQQFLDWEGLSHLPYGVYTLEISGGVLGGIDEMKMRLVKRV